MAGQRLSNKKINFLAKNKFPRHFVAGRAPLRDRATFSRDYATSPELPRNFLASQKMQHKNWLQLAFHWVENFLWKLSGGKFNKEENFRSNFLETPNFPSNTHESGTFGQLSTFTSQQHRLRAPKFHQICHIFILISAASWENTFGCFARKIENENFSFQLANERKEFSRESSTNTEKSEARLTENSLREISPVFWCVRKCSCALRTLSACFDCRDHATRLWNKCKSLENCRRLANPQLFTHEKRTRRCARERQSTESADWSCHRFRAVTTTALNLSINRWGI